MSRRTLLSAAVVTFFVWSLVAPERLFFPTMQGTGADDASYIAYAMTIALDGDLDFTNEIADRVTDQRNGRTVPTHPAGPGLLASPVVALLSVLDRFAGHPVLEDRFRLGGSWSFFGYFLASAGALLAGTYLAIRTVRLSTRALSPAMLLLLIAGTGLPFYGLKRFTLGHSFEFFAAALVLWGVVTLRRSGTRDARPVLLIAAGVAASMMIRPANVNIVLLPAIVHLILQSFPERGLLRRSRASLWSGLALGSGLGTLSTFAMNSSLLGTPYPSLGGQYRSRSLSAASQVAMAPVREPTLELARTATLEPTITLARASSSGSGPASDAIPTSGPEVMLVAETPWGALSELVTDTAPRAGQAFQQLTSLRIVLFSQEFGLVWFMPLVAFGLLALAISLVSAWRSGEARSRVLLLGALVAAYAVVPLGVVLVWQSHASSFGFRYVFSLVPIGLLGFALWAALSTENGRGRQVRIVARVVASLSIISLLGQAFLGTSQVLSLGPGVNSFGLNRPWTAPGFGGALLAAFFQPIAWLRMFGAGLPGFVALLTVPLGPIGRFTEALGIAPDRRAGSFVELVVAYRASLADAAPGLVLVSLLVMGVAIPVLTMLLAREATYEPREPSPRSRMSRMLTGTRRTLASAAIRHRDRSASGPHPLPDPGQT